MSGPEGDVDPDRPSPFPDEPEVEETPTPVIPATKPSKAWVGAIVGGATAFIGGIVTARTAGAEWDADLFLGAIYTALSSAAVTGGAVYFRKGKPVDES